jgi:hypothetical protein
MKYILNIVSFIVITTLMSCGDSGETPKQDGTTTLLTASSWGNAEVTHSDGDLSDQYENFMIVFTSNASSGYNGTFIVANGGNAFSEISGLWKFNSDKTQIILDSEKAIDFTVTKTSLVLEFTVAAPDGKVAGISGHFTFELQPM